jgi:hypothetical protein
MKKKVVKTRNPYAGMKGRRSWGAGTHGDKKKKASKQACRNWKCK